MGLSEKQKVTFPGHAGLSLAGVLHRPEEKTNIDDCLVICHGFRGNKDGGWRAVSLAGKAAKLGITVLRFDFSGTGESEGDFADATLSNYILDLGGAVEFALSASGGKIILLGRSLGGTAAICRAAGDDRVAAVCSWSAPVDLEETFIEPCRHLLDSGSSVLKLPEGNGFYLLKREFFDDLPGHSVTAAAAHISPRPLFVVHGTADETVPVSQGEKLFEAAGEPKKKLIVSQGDHRFLAHYNLVEKRTIDWLLSITSKGQV